MYDNCKYYFIGSHIFIHNKVHTEYRNVYILNHNLDKYKKYNKDVEVGLEFMLDKNSDVSIFYNEEFMKNIHVENCIGIITDLKSLPDDYFLLKKFKGKCIVKREDDSINIYFYSQII